MKNFKKYYIVPAPPEEVYAALTIQTGVELWTGSPAVMEAVPGSLFSLFDGNITGCNLEFLPGQKITQEWFFGEQEEPSLVTLKLHPHSKGTSVEVIQTNIPDEVYDEFTEGWDEMYFAALIDYFTGE